MPRLIKTPGPWPEFLDSFLLGYWCRAITWPWLLLRSCCMHSTHRCIQAYCYSCTCVYPTISEASYRSNPNTPPSINNRRVGSTSCQDRVYTKRCWSPSRKSSTIFGWFGYYLHDFVEYVRQHWLNHTRLVDDATRSTLSFQVASFRQGREEEGRPGIKRDDLIAFACRLVIVEIGRREEWGILADTLFWLIHSSIIHVNQRLDHQPSDLVLGL
jgi:hypothetical protein